MSSLAAVTKSVIKFKGLTQSNNKMKFDMLKSDIKARKQSITVKPGDLNSQYEQDEQMEAAMQKLLNARYEMNDEELEECESGLEDLDEESEETKSENAGDSSGDESSQNSTKEAEVPQKEAETKEEQRADSNISIDPDIQELLENQNIEASESEGNTEDETEGETDDELENVIETEGEDYDDEDDADRESGGDWEEDINYSDLEEEDSDGFSFTGLSVVTDGESKYSSEFGRSSKLNSRLSSRRSRKLRSRKNPRSSNATPDIEDETNQPEEQFQETIPEETVPEMEEENEKEPEITYSRSVSVIEEYESDVFDDVVEEISLDGDLSGEFSGTDTKSCFSIPRARESVCSKDNKDNVDSAALQESKDGGNEQEVGDGGKQFNDEAHNENTDEFDNGPKIDNEEGENDSDEEKVKPGENEENRNESSEEVKNFKADSENLAEFEIESAKVVDSEADSAKLAANIRVKSNDEPLSGDSATKDDINIIGDSKDPCSSSLSDSCAKQVSRRYSTHALCMIGTYQDFRRKNKKKFSKKRRAEVYERANNKKCRESRPTKQDKPDDEIPSYKARLMAEKEKMETVDLVISDLLEMMEEEMVRQAIEREKKRKQDIAKQMIEISLENAFKEIEHKEANRPTYDMIGCLLEDILDIWECQIDERKTMQDEESLEHLASDIVAATIMVSVKDLMGPYSYVLKEPKLKEPRVEESSKVRRKKRLNKKERFAIRENLIKVRKREEEKLGFGNEATQSSENKNDGNIEKSKNEHSISNDEGQNTILDREETIYTKTKGNTNKEKNNKNSVAKKSRKRSKVDKKDDMLENREVSYLSLKRSVKGEGGGQNEIFASNDEFMRKSDEEGSNTILNHEIRRRSKANMTEIDDDAHSNIDEFNTNTETFKHFAENQKRVDKTHASKGSKYDSEENYQHTILQGMDEASADVYPKESGSVLKSLPKANKKEYCRQWLLQNPKVPTPPPGDKSDKRSVIAGRLRRFKKQRQDNSNRGYSPASDSSRRNSACFTNNLITGQFNREASFESGVSYAETGRESSASRRSSSSLGFNDQDDFRCGKRPLSKEAEESIRKYYDDLLRERIAERDRQVRCKEEEGEKSQEEGDEGQEEGDIGQEEGDIGQEEGDIGQEEGDIGQEEGDEGQEEGDIGQEEGDRDGGGKVLDEDETIEDKENGESQQEEKGKKGQTEIEDEANQEEASTTNNDENEGNEKEANGDTVDDDEETELQFDDDVASQKSEDTIYPTESPFVAPDSPRAETPESEPEPEPEPEVRFKEGRKSKSGKNDKKWAWKRATSLMKWNDVQPVIKQGAPANYYRDINLRIRKAIFDSLTLQKPKSLSDLQTNKWPSLYELKNMPVKSQDSARSNVPKRKGMSCISLPPISSQDKNGGKYPKRWSTQDGVNTEPVAPSRNPLKNTTPRVAKRSAEGVWY